MSNDATALGYLKSGYLKTYRVSPYESDEIGRLRLGGLLGWFQDSMDVYSSALGVGEDYCRKQGISYALRGYDISVDSLPVRGRDVLLHTKLECLTPTSFVLRQTMHDKSLRASLLSACSRIVLLNEDGHFVRTTENFPEYIQANVPLRSHFWPNMPVQERVDRTHDEIVPWDYIDFNRHVNNARYVEMAARGLSPVKLKEMQLRRIAAIFKQAAKCGEHLQVQTQENPDCSIHRIVSKDKGNSTYADVCFDWKKKKMLWNEKYRERSLTKPEGSSSKELIVDKESEKKYTLPKPTRRTTYVY